MTPSGAPHVLIVDDDLSMREFLAIFLRRDGYSVATADSGESALLAAESNWPDLVLTDLNMPGMSGMDLLSTLKTRSAKEGRDLEVVVVTAFGTAESAVDAMRLGAFDYVLKPFDNDDLRVTVRRALERVRLQAENARLKAVVQDELHFGRFIGSSEPMRRVYDLIRRIKDTPINCLVVGESGTGKELVARSLHEAGVRKGQFVAINCGAIPENLVESELFGHAKGAFTGADRDRSGLIESAHRGTLFLDEINSLPASAQVKLLRVLQERRVKPVGSSKEIPVDVRVVAASNADLEKESREGRFREDLYYRINVIRIALPPLRERTDDIGELVRHFLERYAKEYRKPTRKVSPPALHALRAWAWPGNVRELENTIMRAVVLSQGEELLIRDLPEELRATALPPVRSADPDGGEITIPDEGIDLDNLLAGVERQWLEAALDACGGNKTRAAKALQMSFRSFRYRLAKYDMDN
jgi:two-component system response regulator PilR (NtrC family)